MTSTIKEGLNIPEKIIEGVIDKWQMHKNKPIQGQQPTYQYPQYQQWNGLSNYQGQGFQPQPTFQGQQFQNQGQYTNFQGGSNSYPPGGATNFQQNGNSFPQNGNSNNYPQGGPNYPPSGNSFPQSGTNFPQTGNNYGSTSGSNFASNQGYPAGSGQSFNQGATQGQYQGVYQTTNQMGQPNNQYPNTQSGYYTQGQTNNQYQGANTGTGQYPGQPGFVGQSNGSGSGQTSQGFYVNGVPQGGQGPQGPTCVCQAWTKPPAEQTQQVYADEPIPEKNEKKEEPPKMRLF